jgi:transposase-like protein
MPATLLGPWHEGDDVRLSILVRNHGSKSGSVKIICEVSGISYSGNSIQLGVDEAGEIFVDVPMFDSGLQMLNWSLQSSDGAIDSGLFGTLNISVSQRQTVEISISSISWDEQKGLSFSWGVNLSEGIPRDVRVRLGYIDSMQESFMIDTVMSLNPGLTEGNIEVGFVDAEKVIVRANEVDWVAGFGFTSLSTDTPQERAIYSITFDPQSTPNRPTAGDSASVKITLSNSGLISGSQGKLILRTSSGVLIGERTTDSLSPQSTKIEQFTIGDWPSGDEVSLVASWEVSRQIFIADEIFISSATQTEEESSGISDLIPGILGGIALAAAIILVLRIVNSRQGQESSGEKKKSTKTSNVEKSELSNVKIQIGCPECSRQLRVPSNYSGSVRCPDCNHNFDVEDDEDISDEELEEVTEQVTEEETEEIKEINDGKIEVGCPECSQTLRIPESYSGSVRCPACKNIFKSE